MTQLLPSTLEDKVLAKAGLLAAARGWTEISWSNKGIEYWRRGDRLFLPPGEEGGEWRELPPPRRLIPASEEEDEWRELLPPSQPKRRRQRKPSIARLVTKAKQLGVDVTIEPNGVATFHTGTPTVAEVDGSPQAELEKWIAKQHAH